MRRSDLIFERPPESIATAPPVLAATSSENFVATACVGCIGVSGWPSLRVTAPWAKPRPDRQIAGMATASAHMPMPPSVLRATLAASRHQAYRESTPCILFQPPATPCVLT